MRTADFRDGRLLQMPSVVRIELGREGRVGTEAQRFVEAAARGDPQGVDSLCREHCRFIYKTVIYQSRSCGGMRRF